jgi:FkbM family methyltransferase
MILKRIKKYINLFKRACLKQIANKNNLEISNNGITPIVNDGYLHVYRTIEYVRHFNLPSDGVVLDVGGGVGATARIFSKAFPKGRVHVFEPIPGNLEKIKKHCAGLQNIAFRPVALGNESHTFRMNLTQNITSSSLLEVASDIESPFFATILNSKDSIEVAVVKLDDLSEISGANILKIDAQGFELAVLKGAVDKLKNINIVVLELANHHFYKGAPQYYEVDQFFREHNFELYDMLPGIIRERKLYEWDSIYVNKSILPSKL